MGSLLFSAAHKSSGKTTLSIGTCAALSRRGIAVQPFKKGPDYIDPIWLAMAAGRPCYNLDFYVAGKQETVGDFQRRSRDADIAIVEGNKGLHDGLDLEGGEELLVRRHLCEFLHFVLAVELVECVLGEASPHDRVSECGRLPAFGGAARDHRGSSVYRLAQCEVVASCSWSTHEV